MVGGRQVGKSTLLKAIERRYADNPQVDCVYLTLSSEVLVPRLASLLKLAFVLGRKDGRWFFRVPLFVDYISEDSPELKLQAELKRIRLENSLSKI